MTGIDFTDQLSRVVGGHTGPKKDFYSATHASTFKVSGRHILNIWRICRSEFNLTQYTFENVVFHLLHQRYVHLSNVLPIQSLQHVTRPDKQRLICRIPHFSSANLTALWKSKTSEHTHRVLKYYFQRVVMYVEIIDRAEIITKNA
jgi:DNA polymerase zeta